VKPTVGLTFQENIGGKQEWKAAFFAILCTSLAITYTKAKAKANVMSFTEFHRAENF
jgi:hypothetical protein